MAEQRDQVELLGEETWKLLQRLAQELLARKPGADTVYRLDYELAEHLPVSLDAFRNRFLSAETTDADAETSLDAPGLELPEFETAP